MSRYAAMFILAHVLLVAFAVAYAAVSSYLIGGLGA